MQALDDPSKAARTALRSLKDLFDEADTKAVGRLDHEALTVSRQAHSLA